jgi:hypothetical protein
MQQDKTVSVAYGLREIAGQRRLVRVESQYNGREATCCGENRYELTFLGGYPLYKVEAPRKALRAITVNPPWHNSDEQSPMWGSVDPVALEVVRINEVVELESIPMQRPVIFIDTIDTYAKPRFLCARYLGRELPDLDTSWQMRLVYIPVGETLETLQQKCTNYPVFIGKGTSMQCYGWGVIPMLEEYVELAKGRPAVILFTSNNHPDDFNEEKPAEG